MGADVAARPARPSPPEVSGLQRRTPLRSDPEKTRDWNRRSRTTAKRAPRGAGLKRVSKKRRASIEARRNTVIPDGPREPVTDDHDHAFRSWVSLLTCAVLLGRERVRVDPAHVRCVRRNGDWLARPDGWEGNIIPLSRHEHEDQHSMGIDSYQRARALDMPTAAVVVGEAYKRGWTAFSLSTAAKAAGGYEHVDLDDPLLVTELDAP